MVLGAGKAAIKNEGELLNIVDVAKVLGLDLENSSIESSKSVAQIRSSTLKREWRITQKESLKIEKEFIFTDEEESKYNYEYDTDSNRNTEELSDYGEVVEKNDTEEIFNTIEHCFKSEDHKEITSGIKSEPATRASNHTDHNQSLSEEFSESLYEDVYSTDKGNLVSDHDDDERARKKVKNFQCNHCKESFANEVDVKKHKRIHNVERPLVCPDTGCGEKFATRSILKFHRANKDKKFKCDVCGFAFGVFSGLKVHKLTHLADKPFKCVICPKQFIQQANLFKHIMLYSSVSEEEHREIEVKKLNKKQFPCDVCGMRLSRKKNVRLHILSVHSDVKPYSCNQCNKSFPAVGNLNAHNRMYHKAFRRQKTMIVLNVSKHDQ